MVTVAVLTVQIVVVVDENVTVRPDEAVALTANGAAPNVLALNAPNVMVWEVKAPAGAAETKQHTSARARK
jgi:hypothetical protein